MAYGFITDRTETDILEQTDKAFMNFDDLARIYSYTVSICAYFGLPYYILDEEFINYYYIPKVTDYSHIEEMLQTLKNRYLRTDLSLARPFNTYTRWNEIESFLEDRTEHVIEVEASKPYCGEFYCGEYGLI